MTKPLDWDEARSRLTELASDATTTRELSPEAAAKLLDARARALASARTDPGTGASHTEEFLHFEAGGTRYAFPTALVREVLREPVVTEFPSPPPGLIGFTLVRGDVVTVVELSAILGHAVPQRRSPALVVGRTRPELALRVDALDVVERLETGTLLPAPPPVRPTDDILVRGATKAGVLVIDGAALLDDPRLVFDMPDERSS